MNLPKLMLLHPDDNVAVCIAPIETGDRLDAGGVQLCAAQALAIGHKLARRAIAAGENIYKYGAPIGSTSRPTASSRSVRPRRPSTLENGFTCII